MIRFLKGLILLPVAIVVVLLAVANKNFVTVSLDPFSPEPLFSVSVPLYALIFAAVALGIVVGGVFSWLGQGKVRARARHHRREADRWEREASQLRTAAPSTAAGDVYGAAAGRTALPAPR